MARATKAFVHRSAEIEGEILDSGFWVEPALFPRRCGRRLVLAGIWRFVPLLPVGAFCGLLPVVHGCSHALDLALSRLKVGQAAADIGLKET